MQEQIPSPVNGWKLTEENFLHTVLSFRDRQAGVSVIYDPLQDRFTYNSYCVDVKIMDELYTCEYEFLDEALSVINAEFGTWEIQDLSKKEGCGSCVAK